MKEPNWTTIERGEFALDCIVCDKPLRNDCGDALNQPTYGLAWYTNGHWPSSLFDSMDGSHLEISICDECMVAKASRQIAFVPPSERQEAFEGAHLYSTDELEALLKGLEDDLKGYDEA